MTPAFGSDCGLRVPWSLIVQEEQLLKACPHVWRVHCCLFQTLELSHSSVSPPSDVSWPLMSGLLSAWLRAGFCAALTKENDSGPASGNAWVGCGAIAVAFCLYFCFNSSVFFSVPVFEVSTGCLCQVMQAKKSCKVSFIFRGSTLVPF